MCRKSKLIYDEDNPNYNGPFRIKETIRLTPYDLPQGYEFLEVLGDYKEISNLIFRCFSDTNEDLFVQYTEEALKWLLNNGPNKKKYMIGIKKGDELVGFVFGRQHTVFIRGIVTSLLSINYLTLTKKLKPLGFATALLKEVKRRAYLDGINYSLLISDSELFSNVSETKCYHRILNVKRLIEIGYCEKDIELKLPQKYLNITNEMRQGTTLIKDEDLKAVYMLFVKYSANFLIFEEMSFDEFVIKIKTKNNLVYTLVHRKNGEIVEFGSFYVLKEVNISKHMTVKVAKLYYSGAIDKCAIVGDLLVYAKSIKCDVVDAFDVMGYRNAFEFNCFRRGDLHLKYSLYNWITPKFDSNDLMFYFP